MLSIAPRRLVVAKPQRLSQVLRLSPQQIRTPVALWPHRHLSFTPQRGAQYARFSPDPEKPFDFKKWDLATKVAAGCFGLGVVYYVAHLEKVPETGRLRFMDISDAYEAKLAKASREEILGSLRGKILPQNHFLTRHVERVVSRILESNNLGSLKSRDQGFVQAPGDEIWSGDAGNDQQQNRRNHEWKVFVVNDDRVVNAMASFGNVVVFTGILPVCKDEQGLAAVLGHEIGHVVARHPAERYSSFKVFFALGLLLQSLGLDMELGRLVTTLLLELPNSRQQEMEADAIGLRLAARACYDPKAAVEMHGRLGQAAGNQGLNLSILQTHPASAKRMAALEGLQHEAYAIQAASPECAGLQDRLQAFNDTVGTWA